MLSWSSKRKFSITLAVVFALAVIFFVFGFLFLYKSPNCNDGKQNQDEKGVDCGGVCKNLCDFQYLKPVILWSRFSKISSGFYNALTYVKNPNPNASMKSAKYVFRFYDKDGLVSEKYGMTNISPNRITTIFEGTINTGERTPERMTFEFISSPVWNFEKEGVNYLKITEENVTKTQTFQKLTAKVENITTKTLYNTEFVAIFYDEMNNVRTFSKTKLDKLAGNSFGEIVFTWPEIFDFVPAKIEIVPKILEIE